MRRPQHEVFGARLVFWVPCVQLPLLGTPWALVPYISFFNLPCQSRCNVFGKLLVNPCVTRKAQKVYVRGTLLECRFRLLSVLCFFFYLRVQLGSSCEWTLSVSWENFARNYKKDLCFRKVIVIATSTSYIENFLNDFVLFFVSAIFWDESYSIFVINLIYRCPLLR